MSRTNDSEESGFSDLIGYEAAFYSLPDPVFIYDHSDRRIVKSNEAAEALYGYTEEELRHLGPWDIEQPYNQEALLQRIEELKAAGSAVYRTEHRAKNGRRFPAEIHTTFRMLNGREVFVAVCRELADRLKVEETLQRQTQRLQLHVVISSSSHLLDLINSILDLAKIESGALEPKTEPVEIAPYLELQLLPLKATAKKKGLAFLIENDVAESWVLETDPRLLLQVFYNIIGNAIKFTEKGSITVQARITDDHTLRIAIADTGIGIEPKRLTRLFTPFQSDLAPISRDQQGSGLGLSITKQILDVLGGFIAVRSQPGQGSVFTISLPGARSKFESSRPISRPESSPTPNPTARSPILLVEDEPNNQRVAGALLKHLGYSFDLAQDAETALTLFKPKQHPIVLMDIKLPGMNGDEATRELRRLAESGPQPYVIAQTAFALKDQRDHLLAEGMDDYVSKPITLNALRAFLQRAEDAVT